MILLAVALLALEAIGFVVWFQSRQVVRRRRKSPVVVTLLSGGGFKGVLVDDDAQALVLRNVEAIDAKATPVDGEMIIPWADVKYLQRL